MSTWQDTISEEADSPAFPTSDPDASRLCERCQPWDSVVDHSRARLWARWREGIALSFDDLLRQEQCLVCRVVTQAVQNELERRLGPDLTPKQISTIFIVNYGPSFQDGPLSNHGPVRNQRRPTSRYADAAAVRTQPTYMSGQVGAYRRQIAILKDLAPEPGNPFPRLHFAMQLEVLIKEESSDRLNADTTNIDRFKIAPRLCAIYYLSPEGGNIRLHASTLRSLDLIDAKPYMDIDMVKGWIQGCEALHDKCVHEDTDSRKFSPR